MKKKQSADDDSESQKKTNVRSPEVCVDYLSYKFDEMDLAASWRMMTKQKKDVVNGIRLENASWRTWAKQRNNLQTISPETLNWLKDSDVTWLYGPLHTVIKNDEEDRYGHKTASAHDTLGLIQATPQRRRSTIAGTSAKVTPDSHVAMPSKNTKSASARPSPSQPAPVTEKRPLKSALKRVTMSDLLRRSASEFSMGDLEQKRSASPVSLSEVNRQVGFVSPAVLATHRQPRLRFNQMVEQYMVVSDDDGDDHSMSSLHTRGPPAFPPQSASADSDSDDLVLQDAPPHPDAPSTQPSTATSSQPSSTNHQDSLNTATEDNDDEPITFYPHQPPRSIKRLEPTVLKSSSYSDQSQMSPMSPSRAACWDDDARSVHLPDYDENQYTVNHATSEPQPIEWEGQQSIVYHAPSEETESEGLDIVDTDWEMDPLEGLAHGQASYNDINHLENTADTSAPSSTPSDPPLSVAQPTAIRQPVQAHVHQEQPMAFSPPSRVAVGKARPISESSPIDAASSTAQPETASTPSQQGQQNHPSILQHITHWASNYLWK
ncbi:hypothetical protein DM01DRAFT_1329558 [Hesseltinella vesiculosa]|uniref:Nitrogen regulatory protein areA GATA-like domain-containing protein n=1 Tax=Hesseltinella vesiculosa TaxID=101127 RepID=A0A1X2G3F1_9FUNG|nr:hypothetical protein DM01DRAFT_1329558 [Hesseltinella vesiculosa]